MNILPALKVVSEQANIVFQVLQLLAIDDKLRQTAKLVKKSEK